LDFGFWNNGHACWCCFFTGCEKALWDCHSEEVAAATGPERSEGRISHCHENSQSESLRAVYPERQSEILRFAQNDSEGLRMTAGKRFSADSSIQNRQSKIQNFFS
jgi:hypothetical protein